MKLKTEDILTIVLTHLDPMDLEKLKHRLENTINQEKECLYAENEAMYHYGQNKETKQKEFLEVLNEHCENTVYTKRKITTCLNSIRIINGIFSTIEEDSE